MSRFRVDRFLACSAVTLVLAGNALAAHDPTATVEALVPVPEPANVPPPTAADVGMSAPQTSPAANQNTTPVNATAPAVVAKPDMDVKSLTGKDLVNAPISPSLAGADVPLAEKLRDLLASKGDRFFDRRKERSAVEVFYRDRGFAPLWVEKYMQATRATVAIAYLKGVDADGLDPADYPIPTFKAGEAEALADAELKLTATILNYARHAQTGRVHFSRVSADIFYDLNAPEPGDIVAAIAGASDVAQALDAYNPPHAGYKALKAKLAEVRGRTVEAGFVRIPAGPVLKVGKVALEDPRVPLLRERLRITGKADDARYDKVLADAVAAFQRQHSLPSNGQLNVATIDALNGVRRNRDADIIIANMERWRWMPRDLGKVYSILNVPDFSLKVMRNGEIVWQTKVVVGKPSTPTPIFSETMKYITVNPTWNVPPSIVANEYLPALQQDPDVLDRMGIKVVQNPDGSIRMYQPPGERNALGRLRFNFPNKFLVYQHDTPDKHLFAQERRAYSHGCMRVQNPDRYAEILLSIALPQAGYTADRLRKMYGGAEQQINFPTPIPVHITYQSAYADAADRLVIRDDVYGLDSRIIAILKGDERRVADVAIERSHAATHRPQTNVRLPDRYQRNSDSGYFFFQRLFR